MEKRRSIVLNLVTCVTKIYKLPDKEERSEILMIICFNCIAIYKNNKMFFRSDKSSNPTFNKSSVKSQNPVRSWIKAYFCLQVQKDLNVMCEIDAKWCLRKNSKI